jgi:two-component system sensor histidine kinase DegS
VKRRADPWVALYAAALRDFIRGGGEAELASAYELGRRAIREQVGLLDLMALHHGALATVLGAEAGGRSPVTIVADAGTFLSEMLSSFEMVHRGFRESVTTLRRINEMLEEQARHIAHALHDDAGQLLASVHLALQRIERRLPSEGSGDLRDARQFLKQMEDHLRTLSHELRPTLLDDLGLLPALEFLAQSVSARSGIPIRVNGVRLRRLPTRVETALYRIVQEALRNAAKHSQARHVNVGIEVAERRVRCSIRDDGRGFDAGAALDGKGPRGLGMIGMRERLDALGGNLVIRSTPGRGTELRITVPLEGHDADTTSPRR